MRMRFLATWFGLSLIGVSCNDDPTPPGQLQVVQREVVLSPFAGCSDLEQYIEDTAVQEMRLNLDQIRSYGPLYNAAGPPEAASAPGADTRANSPTSPQPSAYTTTNTQVRGVDEADFVKNDGSRIFVLSGQTLYASRSWPPSSLALASKLAIEGYANEMFLDDHNRIVIFSTVSAPYPWILGGGVAPAQSGATTASPGVAAIAPCPVDLVRGASYPSCGPSASTTKVTVVDVSQIETPKVVGQYYLPGSYSGARRIGASVRIVLSDSFRYPDMVAYYPNIDPSVSPDSATFKQALDALKIKNEKIIRAQSLADWLPQAKRKLEDGREISLTYNCSDFFRPNAPVHLGLLTVATLNLDAATAPLVRTSILGEPGIIYASPSSLYIATPHWWWYPTGGQSDHTYIHKFDITRADRAIYVASGGVAGHLVDQFSMDEWQNFLRVATTISTWLPMPDPTSGPIAQPIWSGELMTTNRISVLGETAKGLSVVGQTEALAKGERIYSSRFMGKRGFVVTFRQIDPLFTFDLTDPTAPKKVGELKIPGFSTYLHPIDENHLLAIGTLADETGWRDRALKLSLFDVSDFAHPTEKFMVRVGSFSASSEAQYDHRAFNYFAERKLLAIPFTDYLYSTQDYWSSFVSDLRVYDVDVNTGFHLRGALSVGDLYQSKGNFAWSPYYVPAVRRSVMATDAGKDFVYAVSDAGIRVANLLNLDMPMASALFPNPNP